MANFKSKETWAYNEHQDGCQPGKISWTYNNTSDVLVLTFEEEATLSWGGELPAHSYEMSFGDAQAFALLKALNNWAERNDF
jgi:hypothetical protein